MRISLIDSRTNGFKKWSDAQRGKSELAEIDPRHELAGQHIVALDNEAPEHGGE